MIFDGWILTHLETMLESLSVASEGKECPKCSNRMNSLAYRESNIVIDKCPHCEGVWLDHREFDKIVDYLNELVNKTSTRDYTYGEGRLTVPQNL